MTKHRGHKPGSNPARINALKGKPIHVPVSEWNFEEELYFR